MYPITTWLRAFSAMEATASDARGTIEILDTTERAIRWPRTIGADVISIAAIVDVAIRAHGPVDEDASGVRAEWRTAMHLVERHALADLHATFPANRTFWAALAGACVQLHGRQAPLPPPFIWSALLAQLGEDVGMRNVGPSGTTPFKSFDNVKTFDDLFLAQRRYLTELHGADERDPEAGMTGGKKPIPRSTNGEVIILADYWTQQLGRVKRVFGADGVEKRWKAALVDVEANARKADPSAPYARNNSFWRGLQETAIHVAAADEAPSQTDLMLDALTTSLKELPQNIKMGAQALASGASNLAGSIAHGVGKVAHEAGSGLFGGFGLPLLVGGGLVGLYLLTRSQRHESGEG